MKKFGRRFKLIIQTQPLIVGKPLPGSVGGSTQPYSSAAGESVIIEPPTTIRFNVDRSISSTVNSATVQIYNLPKKIREQIFHDYWVSADYKQFILQVGYDSLSTIFQGNIYRAYSARSGPDIITYIETFDGGFATINTKTSVTLNASNTVDIHKTLINEFPTLSAGAMGLVPEDINRPVVLEGNTWDLMQTYTNNQCFIDAEKIYTLADNQVLPASVPLITSGNSILGTPQREGAWISVPILLEPGLALGQIVKLQSSVQSEFDGQYKILGITHNGIISEAVNGECQTTVNLLNDSRFDEGFQLVKNGN